MESTPLTTLSLSGAEECPTTPESVLGAGRKGLQTGSPKWHQILGLGTEIQEESFKGSPAFHPGKSKTLTRRQAPPKPSLIKLIWSSEPKTKSTWLQT